MTLEIKELWEILVPKYSNSGVEYSMDHHHAWDAKVMELSGGMTILKLAKGVWKSPDGTTFKEEMIPVRVGCDEKTIDAIIDVTLDHYDQIAVMAYRVSDYCKIKQREPR